MKTDIRSLADLIARRGHTALAAEFEAALAPLVEAMEHEAFPIAPRSAVDEAALLEALTDLSKLAHPPYWGRHACEYRLKLSSISLPQGMSAEQWRDKTWYDINVPMHAGYDWSSSDPISGGQHFSEFLYQWFFRVVRNAKEEVSQMIQGFEEAFDNGLPINEWIEACSPEHVAGMYPGSRELWHSIRATALYLGFFAIIGNDAAVAALAKVARLLPGTVVLGSDEVHFWHATCS